jgi:diacylglycerol kinase (ATP)
MPMLGFLRREGQRFANTVIWSLDGLRAAWATEKSLRQWTIVNLLSAALALGLDLSPAERALILALGLLVLAAELANTAIEEVVDFVSPDQHPSAKKAKDCGSAAVALTALAGGLAWLVILLG